MHWTLYLPEDLIYCLINIFVFGSHNYRVVGFSGITHFWWIRWSVGWYCFSLDVWSFYGTCRYCWYHKILELTCQNDFLTWKELMAVLHRISVVALFTVVMNVHDVISTRAFRVKMCKNMHFQNTTLLAQEYFRKSLTSKSDFVIGGSRGWTPGTRPSRFNFTEFKVSG